MHCYRWDILDTDGGVFAAAIKKKTTTTKHLSFVEYFMFPDRSTPNLIVAANYPVDSDCIHKHLLPAAI